MDFVFIDYNFMQSCRLLTSFPKKKMVCSILNPENLSGRFLNNAGNRLKFIQHLRQCVL